MGLEARIAPLFTIQPLDWEAPDPTEIQAVLLTSANAARYGGPAVGAFLDLPCYAVGETTAASARDIGFGNVRAGPSDGAALLQMAAGDGVGRALHLCGRDHVPLQHPRLTLVRRVVYAAEPARHLPSEAAEAIGEGAMVLLHSPRAAETFAALADAAGLSRSSIPIAGISETALAAAGGGWKQAEHAASPRDEALLELAAKLCQTWRKRDQGMADER
jgi:uroporphyrinogen-III synthase